MSLKLSEAIRLGAMLKPQGFGSYEAIDSGATCAIGAALEAVGKLHDCAGDEADVFTVLKQLIDKCPACPDGECAELGDAIVHLNDVHRWTRERIADFVETQEQASERYQVELEQPVLTPRA